jgi:NAD(P)H-nitrite reductase
MGDRLICGCMRLHESDIRKAIAEGAQNYEELQRLTGCGTGCGNCRILVEKILKSVNSETDAIIISKS